MAFVSRIGNALRRTSAPTCSPLLQPVRCMSSSKLFVGGLSYATDETTLKNAFSVYGNVLEARVITDRDSGRSKGFGFITFASTEEASAAITSMDGKELQGRSIRVHHANDRAGGIRGGGGFGSVGGGGYPSGAANDGGGSGSGGGGGYSSRGYAANDGYGVGAGSGYGGNYNNASGGGYSSNDGYGDRAASGGYANNLSSGYNSSGMYNTTGSSDGNSGASGEFGGGFSGGGFGGNSFAGNVTGGGYGGSSTGGFSGSGASYGANKLQYKGQDDLLGDDFFDDKEVAESK